MTKSQFTCYTAIDEKHQTQGCHSPKLHKDVFVSSNIREKYSKGLISVAAMTQEGDNFLIKAPVTSHRSIVGLVWKGLVASPERCCGLSWPRGGAGKQKNSEWVMPVWTDGEGLCRLLLGV